MHHGKLKTNNTNSIDYYSLSSTLLLLVLLLLLFSYVFYVHIERCSEDEHTQLSGNLRSLAELHLERLTDWARRAFNNRKAIQYLQNKQDLLAAHKSTSSATVSAKTSDGISLAINVPLPIWGGDSVCAVAGRISQRPITYYNDAFRSVSCICRC